jgi:UDP-N-acetylglucosamine 2-epimerase (non-hydrolysing)
VSTQFHVCITLGTRPEAIKLAPIIHLFRNNPQFQTSVILTGQHREMVEQVMQLFELKADYDLDIMQPKQTLTQITCNSLIGLEKLYKEIQPNIVLDFAPTTYLIHFLKKPIVA